MKVNNYDTYTRSLKYSNPYQSDFDKAKGSTEVRDLLARDMDRSYLKINDGRGLLDRTFDALSVGQYVSAGVVKGLIDPNSTVLGNVWGGLKAANPFGNGYEKGEHSYSKVLETAGWKPDSTFGKVAKGVIGFVGDVMLDPTTYLSGGTSALVKGTGKASKATALTREVAEKLITKQALERGVEVTAEQLSKDADNLVKVFNKTVGVDRKSTDLTLSLANAPFGKKIFGKYADKSVTLSSAEKLQELGDKSIAPVYANLRDSIYGSKLGGLFSTKSALYKASKEDPAKVYDFLKFTEYTRGLTKDQLEAEKLIRDKAKSMNLTPSETKEVLELMQDKTVWNKVKSTVNFLDTKEAQQLKSRILTQKDAVTTKLNDLLESKKAVESLKLVKDEELAGVSDAIKTLEDEHIKNLTELDTSKITKQSDIKRAMQMMQDEINKLDETAVTKVEPKQVTITKETHPELVKRYPHLEGKNINDFTGKVDNNIGKAEPQPDDWTESIKSFDEYSTQKQQRELQRTNHKVLDSTLTEASDKEVLQSVQNADLMAQPKTVSTKQYNSVMKNVQEKGYMEYASSKSAKSFEENYTGWVREDVVVDGRKVVRFHPPEGVKIDAKRVSSARPDMYDALPPADKGVVVNTISKQLYGKEGMIKKSSWDANIEDVIKMMKDGVSKEKILAHIEKNKNFFNGRATQIYPHLAEVLGYKNWDEDYVKPMDELMDKYVNGTIKPHEEKRMLELQQKDLKRRTMLRQFDGMSDKELNKYLTNYENNKLFDGMEDMYNSYNSTGRGGKSIADTRYEKFVDDSMANAKLKDPKLQSKGTYASDLTADERQMHIGNVFNRITSNALENTDKMNTVTQKTIQWSNKVVDEIQPLLNTFFKKEFSQLSPKQVDMLYSMAIKNANTKLSNASELVGGLDKGIAQAVVKEAEKRSKKVLSDDEGLKAISDILGDDVVEEAKVPQVVDKIVENSEISADAINKRDELIEQMDELKSSLKNLDVQHGTQRQKLVDDFVHNTESLKKQMKDIEETRVHLTNATKVGDLTKIDELTDKLKKMDDALSSDDALESFLKGYLGEAKVTDILKNNDPNVGKIVLDTMPVSDKVKRIVKMLDADFAIMAEKEIKAGKLSEEQAKAMFHQYVTHILTEDGHALFKTHEQEIKKMIPNFGDDLGYGRKFNPYSMSRQIHDLPDGNGGLIHNPTIEQINDFFRERAKGKDVMNTNIADIYLTRALKDTELIYDQEYMKGMMNHFGKVLGKDGAVEDGYKAVVNYGQMKKFITESAKAEANRYIENMKLNGLKVQAGDFADKYSKSVEDMFAKMGLDPAVLDDLATPMLELNKEQIAKVHAQNPDLIRQVNDVIVNKANQARKIQMQKDNSRFLQLYDKFTHLIKLNQTTVLPSFHMRNKMSNTFNNWLNIGKDAVNWEFQKKTFQAMKTDGQVEGALKIVKPDGSIDAMKWSEVYEMAKKYGVIDDGYFAKDIGVGVKSDDNPIANAFSKMGVKPKFNPGDSKNFVLYKTGAKYGGLIEGQDRLIHFASELSRGKSFEEATESVNKFLFDYSDLTMFEANVMKRIIPYYTWLRKNASLQLKMMLEDPKKYQYVSKVLGGIEGMNNEEDRINKAFVNDFAKDWVQTPFSVTNPDGRTEPVLWNPNLPFMDVGRIPNPLDPIGSLKNLFTQTNPLIKTPVEQAINRNVFFEQPIDDGKGNGLAKRADHVASQFALYGTLGDLLNKKGDDWKLQAMNTMTGVKALSYDYEKYKAMKLQEMRDKDKKKK